jgi:hypothetical protein
MVILRRLQKSTTKNHFALKSALVAVVKLRMSIYQTADVEITSFADAVAGQEVADTETAVPMRLITEAAAESNDEETASS